MTEAQKSEDQSNDDETRTWRGASVAVGKGTKRELDLVAAVKRRLEDQKDKG